MENNADERAVLLGRYIVNHNSTVRAAAKANCVSKSTVHSDVTKRLKKIDGELYLKVREILNKNKDERHIRGGLATREKYLCRFGMRNSECGIAGALRVTESNMPPNNRVQP